MIPEFSQRIVPIHVCIYICIWIPLNPEPQAALPSVPEPGYCTANDITREALEDGNTQEAAAGLKWKMKWKLL